MKKALASAGIVMVALLAGCGGGGANVTPGPMPAGGTFTGVWHSPQYGEMNMIQTGNHVIGEYVKDERSGRIQGTVDGDIMHFQWQESREMVSGSPSITRGHGYFRYQIGQDGDAYVKGEWGIDANESGGGPWNAVKSRRGHPHLSTQATANSDTSGGDSSDDDNGSNSDDNGSGMDQGGSNDSGSGSGNSDDSRPAQNDELQGLDQI